jgi:hypothetical protein
MTVNLKKIDKQIKEQEDLRNTTYTEIISETSDHVGL